MTDLTIAVTAHSEGILLHKTLLCVERAIALLQPKHSYEILLHLDNPTADTADYVQRSDLLQKLQVTILQNSFGEPGASRNALCQHAKGRYITFIDGDDLFSETWPAAALELLKPREPEKGINQYVAHPAAVLEFGGEINNLVIRHGETNKDTDTLLSVYANRWNVVLMIERQVLIDHPYADVSRGYGYEDWGLNCQTIYAGMHNVLVPETCLFVRRAPRPGSVWSLHSEEHRVLQRNPLLSFANIRTIQPDPNPYAIGAARSIAKNPTIKRLVTRNRHVRRVALKAYRLMRERQAVSQSGNNTPAWLTAQWRQAHEIDKSLFPVAAPAIYDSITKDHWDVGTAYQKLVQPTTHDKYDYVLFAPWIIKGGADLYMLNYVNQLASLAPDKHIAVVSMLNVDSPWSNKLATGIDHVPFGQICAELDPNQRQRLLEQFIENSRATWLHIINAAEAYDFVGQHAAYIASSNKQVILTSFSQSIDDSGRVFGYSHTHVPQTYPLTHIVMSDNQTVLSMWQQEYGFDPKRLMLLRPHIKIQDKPALPQNKTLQVLWAARLSPEKQPQIVVQIGELLHDEPVEITMYGAGDAGFDTSFLSSLPPNVRYVDAYDGFHTLNPATYDAYLYTSLFDGMPNAIIEAGSYGMPIVSSQVGGIPEVIRDGQNGLLVTDPTNASAYAEALKKLIHDRSLCQKYGSAVHQTTKECFSIEQYTKSMHQLAKRIGYIK